MSQRTIQHSVTEFLSVDAEKLQFREVEHYNRTTTINLPISGSFNPKAHYQYQSRNVLDNPDTHWELEGTGGAVRFNCRSAIDQLA
jgi:hypothetical protein